MKFIDYIEDAIVKKIEIVKFDNGKYGVRRKCWYGGYYFLSMGDYWYHPWFDKYFIDKYCMFEDIQYAQELFQRWQYHTNSVDYGTPIDDQ